MIYSLNTQYGQPMYIQAPANHHADLSTVLVFANVLNSSYGSACTYNLYSYEKAAHCIAIPMQYAVSAKPMNNDAILANPTNTSP